MALEDLTTYSKSGVDAGVIAQTAARNTWTNAERNSDAILSKSFTPGFFNSAASINTLYETTDTVHISNDAIIMTWQISNVLKSIVGMIAANDNFVAVRNYAFGVAWGHYLIEGHNGTQYATSNSVTQPYGTVTYPHVYYAPAESTFGTMHLDVYADAGRTSLISALSLALHAVPSFEFFVPFNTRGDAALTTTGWSQNYDLQLPVGGVGPLVNGGLINKGLTGARLIN